VFLHQKKCKKENDHSDAPSLAGWGLLCKKPVSAEMGERRNGREGG
jgi:hypothetical protein